ncbi:MAG: ribosomal protein S18-alanine N-acetyltransferase [Lachnospiraceae bacterium]|jgi:ribosomal-protein-alanine N-acetyltransferase|nr:ribosomal protein S18-alanine N-acetyltransferase [Lachnospiraceae bacterium]
MGKIAIIRPLTPDDVKTIADIDAKCITNPWSEDDFNDFFKYMDNHYLIAECDGQVVGYVGFMKYVDDGDITRIAVLEEYRRNHIAEALLDKLFALETANGVKSIKLEVRESNAAARGLYDKLGFVNVGVRKNYYTDPIEDGIVMSKEL